MFVDGEDFKPIVHFVIFVFTFGYLLAPRKSKPFLTESGGKQVFTFLGLAYLTTLAYYYLVVVKLVVFGKKLLDYQKVGLSLV